jgi:hypothetical protein
VFPGKGDFCPPVLSAFRWNDEQAVRIDEIGFLPGNGVPNRDRVKGDPHLQQIVHGHAQGRSAVAMGSQGLNGLPRDLGIDPVKPDPNFEIVDDGPDSEHLVGDPLCHCLRSASLHVSAQGDDSVPCGHDNDRCVKTGFPGEVSCHGIADLPVRARHGRHHGVRSFLSIAPDSTAGPLGGAAAPRYQRNPDADRRGQ